MTKEVRGHLGEQEEPGLCVCSLGRKEAERSKKEELSWLWENELIEQWASECIHKCTELPKRETDPRPVSLGGQKPMCAESTKAKGSVVI